MKLFAATLASFFLAHSAYAGHIEFYEGGSQGGDRIGTLPDDKTADLRLTNDNYWGGANDEIRSIKLKWVTPGTIIEVFDSPSASRNQDYAQIAVHRWVEEININGLESNRSNQNYSMVYYQEDGNLNGKVSRIRVKPGLAVAPPLEARLNLCMQEVYQFKKKAGTAHEYGSQDSSYRTYYPDISVRSNGTVKANWKMNHVRGWGPDDYTLVELEFDQDLVMTDFNVNTNIANRSFRTDADELFEDLPDAAKKNKYGIAAEAATKAAASLYDFAQRMNETGGRENFENVIEENIDKYGSAIANCNASQFAPAPVTGTSNDDIVQSDQPPPVTAVASIGRYQYVAEFDGNFRKDRNYTVSKKVRVCARGGNVCRWGSDDSTPSVNGCKKIRRAVGKTIKAYGFPGKMLSRGQINSCNRLY